MAGRPSKLTDREWSEIGRRLASGESTSALAREFRVSKGRISERFSGKTETIKTLASQLVSVETAIEQLPVSEQGSVMALADQMRAISNSAASAAKHGMAGANKLMEFYSAKVAKLGSDHETEDLRPIAALAETAQKGASLGLALMQANKAAAAPEDDGLAEALAKARARRRTLPSKPAAGQNVSKNK